MILLADSGSTKCDWLLLKGKETLLQCSSMGFNPYFHGEGFIVSKLRGHEQLMQHADEVKELFFYGAGCSSEELNLIVKLALVRLFPHARVQVGHDLGGAALATYEEKGHIACILGTGSNSCYFDGKSVFEKVPALAYILGDEGSGSYYGKKLIADYMYKRMPTHLAEDFGDRYQVNMEEIVEYVYTRPHANVYLASFMKFCSSHREDPYIKSMIIEGMTNFLTTHVTCYDNYRDVKTNFVGSVAHYFEGQLREAALPLGVNIGNIVKKPILGLKDYHLQHKLSSVS